MTTVSGNTCLRRPPHPLHGILLAFAFPMFLGALLSDIAYANSYQIQWANFAAWLIAGGVLFSAFALVWALVEAVSARALRSRSGLYAILLLAMWAIAFVNALIHARDGWAMMPTGLVLSVVTTILAFAASWIGYAGTDGASA